MSLLSINQLSSLTGHSREHVKRSLSDLPFTEGPKGAHLYDSTRVLTLRLNAHGELLLTEQESRRSLNEAKKRVLELQAETLRRERIPISTVRELTSGVFVTIAQLVKSRRGKLMNQETIDWMFDEFRQIGDGLNAFVKPPEIKPARKARRKPRK